MKSRHRTRNFRLAVLQLEDRLAPATQLLPDLQILPEYLSGWYLDTATTPGTTMLRYATSAANLGAGPFELNGTPTTVFNADGSQSQLVNQKIYLSDGTTTSRAAGTFTYHPAHGHIHFDDFAVARLRTRPGGTGIGAVIASSPKTS